MKINKLNQNSCDYYLQVIKDASKDSIWTSSTAIWNSGIRNHIYGSCMVAITSRNVHDMIMEEIGKYLPKQTKQGVLKSCTTMFYIWQPYSGISKHTDHGYSFAATIYLNKSWDVDWGGNFLYYNKDINWHDPNFNEEEYMYDHENWKVVVPDFATMVLNDDETCHLVTPISPTCPELRYTIQVWGHLDDTGIPLE